MSEKMILPKYTEELMLQIEKEIKWIKELADKNKDVLSNTEDPWEDIYSILEKELGSNAGKKEENTILDVIYNFCSSVDNYYWEALYCLKYNFRRFQKELYIVSEYDFGSSKDLEKIEKYLFKEQRGRYNKDNVDLIQNIRRIHGKQNRFMADIEFDWRITDKNELELEEDNFWVLQLMLLVNDRFNDVFSTVRMELREKVKSEHKKMRKVQYDFSVLNKIRLALMKAEKEVYSDDIDLYIWEKLTRMNMAVLLTNYYMKIKDKFEAYNLSKERVIYEEGMIVGKENVLYTKKEFENDMQRLAKSIGNIPCVLSVLVLIKKCFVFIVDHEEVVLSDVINEIEIKIKEVYGDIILNGEKRIEKVSLAAKIILYLRNKCFVNNKKYQDRENEIRLELNDKDYQKFTEILYSDFDEQQWYQEVLNEIVYLGKDISSPKLETIKSQLEGNRQYNIFRYFYDHVIGKMVPKVTRLNYINQIEDKIIQGICREYDAEWEKNMLKKLKDYIEQKQWDNLEELEKSFLQSGWHLKDFLVDEIYGEVEMHEEAEMHEESEWEKTINEICKRGEEHDRMRYFLGKNFNPYIYEECNTLLWYRIPEISIKEWEKEYNIIQKYLLYH